MPSVPILPSSSLRVPLNSTSDSLPTLLQTPSGLALVELQATIHTPNRVVKDDEDVAMDGTIPQTVVGNLSFPLYDPSTPDETAWMKSVLLYIGKHQLLKGEVKKLPKAMALVRRQDGSTSETMEIAEIVRYKIVFSQRPEPVGDDVAPST
ncbi:hypothetical protein BT63DRAFT_460352 [Microthyrium microscopicum]|uniref:Sister chromatid cohesion protein Ctf8 n=1 Tax=Microthyrium microscopicum TaxID=703497 RepID=A0A6A6TXJ4_9PEZI|nr:hypothetical protein BT63DRAFT_460352 [Microthyrium microscopicum]